MPIAREARAAGSVDLRIQFPSFLENTLTDSARRYIATEQLTNHKLNGVLGNCNNFIRVEQLLISRASRGIVLFKASFKSLIDIMYFATIWRFSPPPPSLRPPPGNETKSRQADIRRLRG